jgi:plastocyanin
MSKGVVLAIIVVLLAVVIGGGAWIFFSRDKQSMAPVVNTQDTPMVVETLPTTPPTTDAGMMQQVSLKKFTVEGSDYKFSPSVMKVNKGDTVQITFKNVGGDHNFVLDEFDVETNTISDGEEEEVEFVADKAGVYEYYCSEGKHREMGMVGKLTVE